MTECQKFGPRPQDAAVPGELVERLEAGERSVALDEACALALGWTQRIVSSIGLNGRTPGRLMWFRPYPHNAYGTQKKSVPRFSGPRMRPTTLAILKATTASAVGIGAADAPPPIPNPQAREEA